MHSRNSQGRRATSILTTASLLLLLLSTANLTTALSPSALITVESSSGGAGNNLSNTTLTIPLSTLYTNPALDTVSTLYLTGATDTDTASITCYPFQSSSSPSSHLTAPAGQPFSQFKPSRLSTTTVPVGSLVCNSTSSTSIPGYDSNVTSTLHATSTQLTRGSVSDVPNLGANVSLPLGPGPVILSSTLSSNTSVLSSTSTSTTSTNTTTTTSTSTPLPTVPNTSDGGGGLVGPPRTVVTSVAVITSSDSSESMITSTRTEVVGQPSSTTSTTGSSVEGSGTAVVVQGSQGAAVEGRRVGSWVMVLVVGGFGVVGGVVLVG